MTEIKASQRVREAAHDWIRTAPWAVKMTLVSPSSLYEAFERFEQAVRADERERAAKVADKEWGAREIENQAGSLLGLGGASAASRIAAAIRAQGDEA